MRDNTYLIGNKHAAGRGPNSGSFKPGLSPWNKGKTGYMGANTTSFKKGQAPPKWYPVGTIVTRTRRDKKRSFIKVSEKTSPRRYAPLGWMEYAKFVWIEKAGYLRDGDVVHHIDGNSMNDAWTNLIAIPRCDHPKIHNRYGLHEPPAELWASVEAEYLAMAEARLAESKQQGRLL